MMLPLTAGEIEEINACGPFHHSVWQGRGVSITQEEALAGRGRFLVERIRDSIWRHFRPEQIPSLSILDVGCYDGWILEQLSDLPFARIVGVEPRAKNIWKGRRIRELLGINSRVELIQASIDSLDQLGAEFDIVLCVGVLHHLESQAHALRKIRSMCRRLLFLETICLSSRHITGEFREELELKDVIYFGQDRIGGISGQKLESPYYDGSATELSVVNIPSCESLQLYLEASGFSQACVVADPESYRAAVWRDRRPFHAVCLEAVPCELRNGLAAGQNYERRLASTLVTSDAGPAGEWQREIMANLRFNLRDKTRLEQAKHLLHQERFAEGIELLRQITTTLNADWRSVYRAFYFLWKCCHCVGRDAEAARYRDLCLASNPAFPQDLFEQGT